MMPTRTAHVETPSDVRSRIAAWLERLGRFPLAFHQLLFRLAIAGVFI